MLDFLSFERFITQDVLIVFYYMGVFFLPTILWIYRKKVSFIYKAYESQNKTFVILVLFFTFLMMQLFWRMMFEAMIGYFDMHTYLHDIVQHIQ